MIIETDDTLKFIGNLNNYIFLYEKNSKTNLIYNLKDITNLKIK